MRRLVSGRQKKRIQRRNQFIVGFILVFLMVTSTLGFAFQGGGGSGDTNGDQNVVDYNGFSFENVNGFWVLGNFVFRNLPNEVPEINSELENLENYRNKPLYIFSESVESESEIIVNLGPIVSEVEIVNGGEITGCEENFITIEESVETKIIQERNCVFIYGSADNLIKLTDQFLFKIIGIK
jgi:hypothetical protein